MVSAMTSPHVTKPLYVRIALPTDVKLRRYAKKHGLTLAAAANLALSHGILFLQEQDRAGAGRG